MGIGKILKHLRTATDTSQAKLARELGITPGYLSLVENDKRQPSLPFLESAAAYFRITGGSTKVGPGDSTKPCRLYPCPRVRGKGASPRSNAKEAQKQ